MSTVLYRKYRPKSFSELIGQEHVVRTITNALIREIVSHAYLFSGPRGSGKTTIARLLAKSLNCHNRKKGEFEPCNNCPSCREIMENRSLDLIEIDAASNRGIDEIRDLREGIRFSPAKEKYKVFVIDECLTGDHLVAMADGRVKKISEVQNNERVASIDLETGNIVEGKIKNWFKRETDQIVKIKTSQASLESTLAHRLWIMRDGNFLLKEAKEIKINDFLLSPVSLPHVQKNDLSPGQLGLLALIQCDGHVSKDSITIQVEISKDKDFFKETIIKGLKAWGIKEKAVIKKTIRGTRLIRIYSKELKDVLIGLGCPEGKKGNRIDIPDIVFQAPLESIKSYIDICFCCEGNLYFNKKLNLYRLHFNSTSKIFTQKLQLLLKKFGISSGFITITKKDENHFDQYRLSLSHYNLSLFQQKIGLSLKRKNRILTKCAMEKERQDSIPIEKIIIEEQEKNKLSCSVRASLGIYPDRRQHLSRNAVVNFMKAANLPKLDRYLQFRYEKVKEIQILDKKEAVYDFTVENTHTFIANGICSSNCHQLTKEAVNALLKTLEEPPSHAIFVLATTEIHKMIPTIISRCQRFDFRKLRLDELITRLEILSKKEGVEVDKDAFNIIAINSGGALRDAESLLDQVLAFSGKKKKITGEDIKNLLGIADLNMASQFIEFIVKKDTGGAIRYLQSIVEKGYDPQEFIKVIIQYMRQSLIMKINPGITNPIIAGLTEEEQMVIKEQTKELKEGDIKKALNLFLEAENKMKYSSIVQLPLELAIIDITVGKE